MKQRSTFLFSVMAFGIAFLYVPILSMMFFSFNRSRLATVWGGFSTQWYGKLFSNSQVIDAALLSLRIALLSATLATILGTMAGLALAGSFGGAAVATVLPTEVFKPIIVVALAAVAVFVAVFVAVAV